MEGIYFKAIAAMLDKSRGIGFRGDLPWPPISRDYEYLKQMCRKTSHPEMKNIAITGRISWDGLTQEMRTDPKVMYIMISKSVREKPQNCTRIATDFKNALLHSKQLMKEHNIDTIWILGGENIYKESLALPNCTEVYLTRIFADFSCDTYFPLFENNYKQTRCDENLQEDNGIQFRFEVYRRNDSPLKQ